MFKLYSSNGKNATVDAEAWSVNGGKEGRIGIKRMFLGIAEKNA